MLIFVGKIKTQLSAQALYCTYTFWMARKAKARRI